MLQVLLDSLGQCAPQVRRSFLLHDNIFINHIRSIVSFFKIWLKMNHKEWAINKDALHTLTKSFLAFIRDLTPNDPCIPVFLMVLFNYLL